MPSPADDILRGLERLHSQRGNWHTLWQDVNDYVSPVNRFLDEAFPGEEKTRNRYDATATVFSVFLASAIHGTLINPATKWMTLGVEDTQLEQRREVRLWMEQATDVILSLYSQPDVNFYQAGSELILNQVNFGTGVWMQDDTAGRIRFNTKPLSDYYAVWDHRDELDKVYARVRMTPVEVLQRWPDTASLNIRRMVADPSRADEKVQIIHHVARNTSGDGGRAWRSFWVERDAKSVLSVGGFDTTPYLFPRWRRDAGEDYGRCPTLDHMPDIKMLQAMRKTTLEGAEMAVHPPMFVPSGSVDPPFHAHPRAVIYGRIFGGKGAMPQPITTGRVDFAEAALKEAQDALREAYFVSMFQIPDNDRMTATEIIERTRQRLQVMSPLVGRIQNEWLDETVFWTFRTLRRRGMIPPPPAALEGRPFKPRYISPLALSQRAGETQGFLQLMQLITPLVQADPSVMLNIDSEGTVRYLAALLNVSERTLRSESEVRAIRERMNQQAQQQQQAELANTVAQAAERGAGALAGLGGA